MQALESEISLTTDWLWDHVQAAWLNSKPELPVCEKDITNLRVVRGSGEVTYVECKAHMWLSAPVYYRRSMSLYLGFQDTDAGRFSARQ